MAENINQVHPEQAREVDYDTESVNSEKLRESKTRKAMRRLAYVTVIVLFLTVAVLVFALTFMRIGNPKLRIRAIEVENLVVRDSKIELRLGAEVSVKNTNFGYFEFEESSIEFVYDGDEVGEGSMRKGEASARSTERVHVTATVEIDESPSIEKDVKLGILRLKSQASLTGEVHLLKVITKHKTIEMSCTVVINLVDKVVRDLKCN